MRSLRSLVSLVSRRSCRRNLAAFAFVMPLAACALPPGEAGPEPAPTPLVVHNQSFYDVNVYTLAGSSGLPVRLGTVTGLSTAKFALRASHLQPGGALAVSVRAISSSRTWSSPTVSLTEGTVAVLDVTTDGLADCSSSSLHTVLASSLIR